MITILAVGTVLAGLVGYGVWAIRRPEAKWQTHESARGGYKAEFPATPRNNAEQQLPLAGLPGVGADAATHRRLDYVVMWGDIQGRQWRTDAVIIQDTLEGIRASGNPRNIKRGESFTVGGFAASDMEFTAENGEVGIIRVIVADTRLYVLAVGGRGADPQSPDVRRFLDSFEITDGAILTAGQRRVAEVEAKRLAAEADAKRREEARREEDERFAAEQAAVKQAREKVEAETQKFLAVPPGLSPDPATLSGLKVYLSFDSAEENQVPITPSGHVRLDGFTRVVPGVRGKAVYLNPVDGALLLPPELFPSKQLHAPLTYAFWYKTRAKAFTPFHATGMQGQILRVTLERGRVRVYVHGGESDRGYPPGEMNWNSLSVAHPGDEGWHHIALTWGEDRGDAALYLDGKEVARFSLPPRFPQKDATRVELGQLNRSEAAPSGNPKVVTSDLPTAALDEFCVFDRALTPSEVSYLAGKVARPVAQSPPPVRLVPQCDIGYITGAVFDPGRKAVWAVTASNGMWTLAERPQIVKRPPGPVRLVRYSYPDFKVQGSWLLPRKPFLAVPLALDAKNNRLFMVIPYGTASAGFLQRDDPVAGQIYRFDLDDLPPSDPNTAPVEIKASAESPKPPGAASHPEVGDLIVSPDGSRVYYTEGAMGSGEWKVRSRDASLTAPGAEVDSWGDRTWARRFSLSPDGKTLHVVQGGKASMAPRNGQGESGLFDVTAPEWKAGPVAPIPEIIWTKPSPYAIHPDGRVFVARGYSGITEITAGQPNMVVQRPAMVQTEFLNVSPGGRFLFASEADFMLKGVGGAAPPEFPKNRLAVLDASRTPSVPGVLAHLDATPEVRVGGPFNVSPDGKYIVFRSGLVVRVDEGAAALKPPSNKGGLERPNPPTDRKWDGSVPAATEFPGLKFYITGDEFDEKTREVRDAVSGKVAAKLGVATLVDGPRGKALQISAVAAIGREEPGLKMTALSLLRVPADKPFTLAFWLREDSVRRASTVPRTISAHTRQTGATRQFWISLESERLTAWMSEAGTMTTPGSAGVAVRNEVKSQEWNHVAFIRNDKNELRLLVGGRATSVAKPHICTGPFDYELFEFPADGTSDKPAISIDEFCLFDRALTDDEIAALAGRKELPKKRP